MDNYESSKLEPEDPFEKLFEDDSNSLRLQQQIADAIYPFVRLSRGSSELTYTERGEALPIKEKLLVAFLANKVLYEKKVVESEIIGPSDLEKRTGILGGSLRPALKKLVDEKLIKSADKGEYLIPANRIKNVRAVLDKWSNSNSE